MQGIVFDEPFFDAVIKRAGGERLTDRYPPPPKTKQVDYILRGFVIELKILTSDPLDAEERQAAAKKFIEEKMRSGELQVSPANQVIFTPQQSKELWERILGRPIQDRLQKAARQIRDTLAFVPGSWRGGVIIVNSAGSSFDWRSFSYLADHYHGRFPEIQAVFALHGVPDQVDGHDAIYFATMSKDGHWPEADSLGNLLDNTIRAEIAERTHRVPKSVATDTKSPDWKASFHITPNGIRRKK